MKKLSRRTIVKALPLIGATGASVPIAAGAKSLNIEDYPLSYQAEHHARQLTRSLEARYGGSWFFKIENEYALFTSNNRTPDERIQTAIADLESALRAKYPGFDVRHHRGQTKRRFWGSDESTVTGEMVGVCIRDDLHPDETLCMCTDDGPLRADDVTGTNDVAEWEARRHS